MLYKTLSTSSAAVLMSGLNGISIAKADFHHKYNKYTMTNYKYNKYRVWWLDILKAMIHFQYFSCKYTYKYMHAHTSTYQKDASF